LEDKNSEIILRRAGRSSNLTRYRGPRRRRGPTIMPARSAGNKKTSVLCGGFFNPFSSYFGGYSRTR